MSQLKSTAARIVERKAVEETKLSLVSQSHTSQEAAPVSDQPQNAALSQTSSITDPTGFVKVAQPELATAAYPPSQEMDEAAPEANEDELASDISKLWEEHEEKDDHMKKSKAEKAIVLSRLAESLYLMKARVSQPGCKGGDIHT